MSACSVEISDVVVALGEREVLLLESHAAGWTHPGRSHVRAPEERVATLSSDQATGLAANLAGCIWLFGRALGMHQFEVTRWAASRAPLANDGGCDVPGRNIDFKGQLMRTPLSMERYRLPVRPADRRPGWVYVHCLVEVGLRVVHLRGWACDEELPGEPDQDGPVAGAFTVPYERLHRLPPFRSVVPH